MFFQKAVLPFLISISLICFFVPEKEKNISGFQTGVFSPVSFDALKGWRDDDMLKALPALRKSCTAVLMKKNAWRYVCNALVNGEFDSSAALRAFLEKNLTPYAVDGQTEGTFTGYYEPEIPASLKKTKKFKVPLYAVPDDMVTLRGADFSDESKSFVFFGKISGKALKPYPTRAEIEDNPIPAETVAYVEHKADALILQIQGSGVLVLNNGKRIRLSYAADNGRAFTGIGAEMLKEGILKEKADMETIRQWLIDNPEKADVLIRRNERYIFFKINENEGAVGALGVVLTPERSLAVDSRYIPLGSFLWLETRRPVMNLLVSAQDTGAAIKGAVRGDFFYGAGAKAFKKAAVMKSKGVYFILLPKNFQERTL